MNRLAAATLGVAAAAAGAGSVYSGYVPVSAAPARSQSPESKQYAAKLASAGFEPFEPRVPFLLRAHRRHMFSSAVLGQSGRLQPEGHLRNPNTGAIVSLFRVGEGLREPALFAAAATTLFDEQLAMAAFQNLPNGIGVTGTLVTGPITGEPQSARIVALHATPTVSRGRRAEAEGALYDAVSGNTLATASVVMIEPSWGKYLAVFL